MKISLIIASLGPGGAERVCVSLANYLANQGHEITLITLHHSPSFYPINERVRIFSLPSLDFSTPLKKISSRIKKLKMLRRALRKEAAGGCEAFISFLDSTNILCCLAQLGLKTPLIISEHSTHSYLRGWLWRLARRASYPLADALTVLTEADKRIYARYLRRVRVMANPSHFSAMPLLPYQKEDLILFIGRLDKNKNPGLFIRAAAKVGGRAKFIIIGEGPLRGELESLAEELGAPVNFAGQVAGVSEFYERAKIICLCSAIEGLPTVLLEAIYFDVARISTAYENGSRELISHGENGLLIEFSEPEKMAEELAAAITGLLDDEARRLRLTAGAGQDAAKYSLPAVTAAWLEFIAEVKNA